MAERWAIGGESYAYLRGPFLSPDVFQSFDRLAQTTFGLSFSDWRARGFWQEAYIPHLLMHGGEVVANVSANIVTFDHVTCRQALRLIQLGTVMTDERYQGRGLSTMLIDRVINDYKDRFDGLYLYANDSVTGFYPRFGFQRACAWRHRAPLTPGTPRFRRMDLSDSQEIALLQKHARVNPHSSLTMQNNPGLLMFHCLQAMPGNIYFSETHDAAMAATYADGIMTCHEIFGGNSTALWDLLRAAAHNDTTTVVLGFTPLIPDGFTAEPDVTPDSTLFVHGGRLVDLFAQNRLKFPSLSEA